MYKSLLQISIFVLGLILVSYQYPCVTFNSTHCVHFDFPKTLPGNLDDLYISKDIPESMIALDPFQKDSNSSTVYKIASSKKCVDGFFSVSSSKIRNVTLSDRASCEPHKVYPYDSIASMLYELPKGELPADGKFLYLRLTSSDKSGPALALDGQMYTKTTHIELKCSEFNTFSLTNIEISGLEVHYHFTFYSKAGCGILQKKDYNFNGLLAFLQEYLGLVILSSVIVGGILTLTVCTLCLGGCCGVVLLTATGFIAYKKMVLDPALYRKKLATGSSPDTDTNNELFLVPAGRTNYETPQRP